MTNAPQPAAVTEAPQEKSEFCETCGSEPCSCHLCSTCGEESCDCYREVAEANHADAMNDLEACR